MTAAPKPPENRHDKQQETKTNGGEKLQLRTSESFFFFFFTVPRVGPSHHDCGWRGEPPEFLQTNSFSASCRPWAKVA